MEERSPYCCVIFKSLGSRGFLTPNRKVSASLFGWFLMMAHYIAV